MNWKALLLPILVFTTAACATPVEWDTAALAKPPRIFDAPSEIETPDGVHAVCFEGLPWRGNPTRVFAYYGVPATATPANPAPGIVLVHGAGGTAFARWVKTWVDRGYAAIAFDHDGGMPVGKYSAWERLPGGGPRRGDLQQLNRPVTDQWMHHAVADTMLAHSLLASLPEVDADRIGATGISWGGVILANTAGVDSRLKFAAMVYGCGFIAEETDDGSSFVGSKGTAEQRAAWSALWDPSRYLPAATMPMLWLSGADDFAFTPKARQQSVAAAPGPQTLSLLPKMPHTHSPVSEAPEIIHAFANHLFNAAPPLPRITDQSQQAANATVRYTAPDRLRRAELIYTTDLVRWQDRKWQTIPAEVRPTEVRATVPADATVYYFNLTDERGLTVSSDHRELAP